jgi:hypothetical protein
MTISQAIEVRMRSQSPSRPEVLGCDAGRAHSSANGKSEPAKNFYARTVSLWAALPTERLMILTAH